ncbi:MAG: C15orf41 family protein [Methanosarcinaceae archaeon]|nr:C15orf41 family protein [Methanosarcinaceae archaeon]
MDEKTYLEIYDSVNTFEDAERISREIHAPVGIITTILQQKVVRRVIQNHARMQRYTERHLQKWQEGNAILHIAQWNRFPATLMAAMILKEMGHSKKYINIMFKNPETIRDRRLRTEVVQALNSDYFYSPKAHQNQRARGQMGENIIKKWLDVQDIVHLNENDLRKNGKGKTPDFVLDEPLTIDNTDIRWIESKSTFGEVWEHQYYYQKQFKHYEKEYGQGLVVYWYGFVDSISLEGHLIKDYEFFDEMTDVDELLGFAGNW